MPTPKKYWGFIMRFGYVECAYVSLIHVRHTRGGFDTLKEALTSLAHAFLDDYLDGFTYSKQSPTLEGFDNYLAEQPTYNAGAGPCFMAAQANAEEWWAWDTMAELYPYLDKFWENTEPMEYIIPHYLDANKIDVEQYPHLFNTKYNYTLKPEALDKFRQEVIERQIPPTDEWSRYIWEKPRKEDCFVQVGRKQEASNEDEGSD